MSTKKLRNINIAEQLNDIAAHLERGLKWCDKANDRDPGCRGGNPQDSVRAEVITELQDAIESRATNLVGCAGVLTAALISLNEDQFELTQLLHSAPDETT